MLSFLPSRFTRQPQQPARLDPRWNFGAASAFSGNINVGNYSRLTAKAVASPQGIAGQVTLVSAQTFSIGVPVTPSWSLLMTIRRDSQQGNFPYFLGFSGGITYQAALFGAHSSVSGHFGWLDSVGFNDSGFFVALGETVTIGLTFDSATNRYTWYKNGRAFNSIVGNPTGSGVWQFSSVANEGSSNTIPLMLIAPKILSAPVMLALTANPWQAFISPQRLLFDAPAGGAPYTLPAAAGSYSLSGNAIALRAARNLTAAAGTYALTGTAAALRISRTLAAAPGAYSLTGSAAALRTARALPAAPGSYALTGNAISMRATRRLPAGLGTYSMVGNAIAMFKTAAGARTMVATPGSYAITGAAANLRTTRRVTAATGVYALTGYATIPPAATNLPGRITFRRFPTKPMRVLRLA